MDTNHFLNISHEFDYRWIPIPNSRTPILAPTRGVAAFQVAKELKNTYYGQIFYQDAEYDNNAAFFKQKGTVL